MHFEGKNRVILSKCNQIMRILTVLAEKKYRYFQRTSIQKIGLEISLTNLHICEKKLDFPARNVVKFLPFNLEF